MWKFLLLAADNDHAELLNLLIVCFQGWHSPCGNICYQLITMSILNCWYCWLFLSKDNILHVETSQHLLPADDNEHTELLILLIVSFQGQHSPCRNLSISVTSWWKWACFPGFPFLFPSRLHVWRWFPVRKNDRPAEKRNAWERS